MPTYELSLMFRTMPKMELARTIKRTAIAIFDREGIIRSIENLGHRQIPYTTSAHGIAQKEASYYLIKFDGDTKSIQDLNEEYGRDIDIIRRRFYKIENEPEKPCTLHDEMLPPAYRKDVQKMMKMGSKQRNRFTYKFKYNSGLNYYPFQK